MKVDRKRKAVSPDAELVERFRVTDIKQLSELFGIHCKQDIHYESHEHRNSRCYHLSLGDAVFEIIITGMKWYSVRRGIGGGGSIDLTMHLYSENYTASLNRYKNALQRKIMIENANEHKS